MDLTRGLRAYLLVMSVTALGASWHPADVNEDGQLTSGELADYAAAYVSQSAWPAGPSPVPESYYEQAVFIWRHGELYREVPGAELPRGWVPAPADGTVYAVLTDANPAPMDFVEVLGVPAGATNLFAEFQVPGDSELYYSGVRETETGGWELLIPIVPRGVGGGGSVELALRQEDVRFPLGPIEIAPLAPAPGAAAEMASELELLGDVLGDLTGADLADYYDGNAPDELRPFVALDKVVRDPSNANNLVNVLRGTAPVLTQVGEYNPDMTDRLWAKLGIASEVRAIRMGLQEAAAPGSLQRAGGLERMGFIAIPNLTRLSELMKEQCDAQVATDPKGPSAGVKAGFGYASAAIGLMGPVGAAFALGAGVTSFVIDTYQQGVAALLPSEVPTFELFLDKTEFTEDFCEFGRWEVKLSARNRGWSLDKTLVQGLFTATAAARGIKGMAGEIASREPMRKLSDNLADGAETVAGQAINEMFPGNTSVFTIDQTTWDNIPVTEGDFGLLEVSHPGGAVKQDAAGIQYYTPAQVGNGGVKVVTNPGVLGCEAAKGKTALVAVLENKVSLTPNGGEVQPGQELEFTATVTDAFHKDLQWEVDGGTILNQSGSDSTGVYTLLWKAPDQENFPPVTIRAWSPTQFCLREGITRERQAIMRPVKSNLILVPDVTCVQRGGTQTFTVLDDEMGQVTTELLWSLEGPGTLNPDGANAYYSADGEGTVTVRVHPADSPTQVMQQTFNVGECYGGNLTVFDITPSVGWDNVVYSQLFIHDLENPDKVWLQEYYPMVGSLYLSDATERFTGTFAGLGMAQLLPEEAYVDPQNYDDGSRTFETADQSRQYELTLTPAWSYAETPENELPMAVVGDGKLEVRFVKDGSLSGDWPTEVQIERHEWEFSDGARYTGDAVTHTFDVGPDYDQWIKVTVVDSAGHSATGTWHLRFIEFITEFDMPFTPGSDSLCFDFPIPGMESDCTVTLRALGPHAGDKSMTSIAVSPYQDQPEVYGLQISF